MLDSAAAQSRRASASNVIIAVNPLSPRTKEYYLDCGWSLDHWDAVSTSSDNSPANSLDCRDITYFTDISGSFTKKRKLAMASDSRTNWNSLEVQVGDG